MLDLATAEAALAVAAASLSLSKGSLFEKFHAWAYRRSKLLGSLVTCPFCLAHWFAAAAALFLPHTTFVGYLFTVGALIMIATLLAGAAMRLLLWDQVELDRLRDERDELEAKNADLLETMTQYRSLLDRKP